MAFDYKLVLQPVGTPDNHILREMFEDIQKYFDTVDATYLPLAGGTMTGDLNLGGNDITGVASLNDTFIGHGRNRVLNGDMIFDQRKEGGTYTVNASSIRLLDMWIGEAPVAQGVFTVVRDTAVVPTGFLNSMKVTVTTADTSGLTSEDYDLRHVIEGLTVRDFLLGTANAKTFTVSFWVRSSLTGTFGFGVGNSAFNRSYIAQYTINAANTWEYKTVTITGDTSGTWLTTNGVGMRLTFDLGAGTDKESTAGSWLAANKTRVSGNARVLGTNGATWYITGLQVELGSTASAFEHLPYDVYLNRIQRYIWKTFNQGTAAAQNGGVPGSIGRRVEGGGASTHSICVNHPVRMRSTPSATFYNPSAANALWRNASDGADSGAAADEVISEWAACIRHTQTGTDNAQDLCIVQALFTAEI